MSGIMKGSVNAVCRQRSQGNICGGCIPAASRREALWPSAPGCERPDTAPAPRAGSKSGYYRRSDEYGCGGF